jgi:Protein of unknown function (DUF1549)/Protein of unknown function (DUF1553)
MNLLRCLALAFLINCVTTLAAQEAQPSPDHSLPSPAQVKKLDVHPAAITLIGSDDSRQLVITGTLAERMQDLTGDVTYKVADEAIVRVTSAGRVVPLANGVTTITANYGDKTVTVAVTTQAIGENLPINFGNHIVPIFTKLGCNGGGCHGKSGGQNGFGLSLLGFVPEFDYQALVKEDRGRRLLLSAPDFSLLLQKATGTMAHAGGKRLEVGSDEYNLIRRWIAGGAAFGSPNDPKVTKISVYPDQRIISRKNRQQFAVLAHYSDGQVIDVTGRAQFESNDTDIAIVDGAGLVRSLDASGEAAIMARYQGQVAVFRAMVPLGMKIPKYEFEPRTVVDRFTNKKWQELGIVPSDPATDEQFMRRVSLDITGTMPSAEKVKAFLADNDPNKRDKLIDALLETPEYAYFFANRWADILRVKRGNQNNQGRAFGTFAFHGWIRDSIARDQPYDQFVREILTALGDETKAPTTMWYRDLQKPEQFVDDTCQLFLGVRMACAQCHHHPYEKWSQDDYFGMAAFFAQIGRKALPMPGLNPQGQQNIKQVIFNKPNGNVINTRTQKPATMKVLDGPALTLTPGDDPRPHLVDWMVAADNPFFARAMANRYWAHFFGKGIVDPLDDMRVTNPPSNPELLDALAQDLIDAKFSLKHLIRTITRSRTYQLSALPNDFNMHDKKSFARFYPRRLSAEVLFDAVSQTTGSPAVFAGLPKDKFAPNRAIMLPDEAFGSYFLDVFGRPQRISACECERVTEANMAQSLHLLNSQEIQSKLTRVGGKAEQLAKDKRDDNDKIDELFLGALGRYPTETQRDLALADIERNAKNKRNAYENIIWALINTKEFILNQ